MVEPMLSEYTGVNAFRGYCEACACIVTIRPVSGS